MKITNPALFSRKEDINLIFDIMNKLSIKELKECTLNSFDKVIIKFSEDEKKNYTDEQKNKLKGDIFEIFAELYSLFITSAITCGFKEYQYNEEDYGVDGWAKNYAGNNCVVQVKFRANPNDEISYEDLAKTGFDAIFDTDYIDPKKENTIILFTNSSGANDQAIKRINRKIKRLYVVNKEIIEKEVNGNALFWQNCYEIIQKHFE